MSDARQETVSDIVADIRAQNQGLPEDGYALSPLVCDLLRIADRIEAAAKSIEADRDNWRRQALDEDARANAATIKDSLTVGNAAAMRDACANIAEYAKTAACHTEDAHLLGYLNQIERWAEAALSAPPRNCDDLEVCSDYDESDEAIREEREAYEVDKADAKRKGEW